MNIPRSTGPLAGLYVILDPSVCPGQSLDDILKEAAGAGVKLFQYRNKAASMKEAYTKAMALLTVAA